MYAIHRLSTDFVLSAIEKVHFARAYKVASWLDEGITGLVNGDPNTTLDDFASLGWETAARILWIMRDNSFHSRSPMLANTLYFKKDTIKCGYCSSSYCLLNSGHNCYICRQLVPSDTELTAPDPGIISGPTDRVVQLKAIQCSNINCRGAIFSSISLFCRPCSVHLGPNHNVRITPKRGLKEMIEETFGEEIRNSDGAQLTTSP